MASTSSSFAAPRVCGPQRAAGLGARRATAVTPAAAPVKARRARMPTVEGTSPYYTRDHFDHPIAAHPRVLTRGGQIGKRW